MTEESKTRVKCPEPGCGKDFQPIASKKIRTHKREGLFCPGGGQDPLVEGPGPFDPVAPSDAPDPAAPLEGSPEFVYRDTAGRVHGNGGRLCRVCERPHPLTPNGRVRTHPAAEGSGNCAGGSDFPHGDYPDIEGPTNVDPRPTVQELRDAEAVYTFGGDVPADVESAAQGVINRAAQHGTRPVVASDFVAALAANGHATDAAAEFLGVGRELAVDHNAPGEKGPWIDAAFPGECGTDGAPFDEGDRIRADGEGGWEAEECCGDAAGALTSGQKRPQADIGAVADFFGVTDTPEPAAQAPEVPKRVQASMDDVAGFFGVGGGAAPTVRPAVAQAARTIMNMPEKAGAKAEEDAVAAFLAPVPAADDNADRYGRWGKYKILHPETGKDNCLFTRATTMAKDISSTFALNQWKRRKAVFGLGIEPAIHQAILTLDPDKRDDHKAIDTLIEKAEQLAGSKIGAELGTALHSLTERLDKGEGANIVPPVFQDHVRQYAQMLLEAGLVPVKELIERTTVVLQYSTAGTMDRVFLVTKRLVINLPGRQVVLMPGEYVIGDLKTAKGMQYAWGETAIQLSVYAHGLNSHGYFDWDTRTWVRPTQEGQLSHDPIKVREDVALVVHLPADRAKAEAAPGVHGLDIAKGWAALGLVDQVRGWRGDKTLAGSVSVSDLQAEPVAEAPAVQAPAPVAEAERKERLAARMDAVVSEAPKERHLHAVPDDGPSWEDRFQLVSSQEEASALWAEASANGVSADRLAICVAVAKKALEELAARPAPPVSTGCAACDQGGHVCPGCGELASHERPVCWSDLFRNVATKEEATALWTEASEAGVPAAELTRLVGLAKEELARLASLESERLAAQAREAVKVAPAQAPTVNWEKLFAAVVTPEEAGALWKKAGAAGVPEPELDRLVKVAKAKLSAPTTPITAPAPARPVVVAAQKPKAPEPDPRTMWGSRFAAVGTKEEAGALWAEASKAGVPAAELDRLVGLAKDRLTALAQRPTAHQIG